MRNILLALFISLFSFITMAQEKAFPHLLETDSTWSKEIIPFPISFAPEFKLKGYEDAQFLPGWGKQESPEFWSYILVWNIEDNQVPSANELEVHLETYMDGLMKVVNKDSTLTVPPSSVLLLKNEKAISNTALIGKVKVHDSFRTEKVITLNLKVDYQSCEERDKTMVVFRFSLKEFGDDVWHKLDPVELRKDACEL